jgi:hypothetical protein
MDPELQNDAHDIPAEPAAPVAVEPTDKAANMHDAIFARDEKGRFAPKTEDAAPAADGQPAPAVPEAAAAVPAAPVAPAAPAAPEDITKMPDGLQPKAQERFQRLVTEVKARDEQIEELRGAVSYVQETFQQHGVKQEQFEQAVGFIGAINRGDYASAEQLLLGQLRQLSLLTGKDYGGEVDPLAEFPDIAQKVQGLQIAREDAIEIARMRRMQAQQQHSMQSQQAQLQQTQQAEQQFKQAQTALDGWARQMAAQDIDWPKIEAKLLPVLPELLKGVPPAAWANVVQTQYRLLKNAAQEFRVTPATTPSPLRPTGAASPQQRPGSMYEAMFGGA